MLQLITENDAINSRYDYAVHRTHMLDLHIIIIILQTLTMYVIKTMKQQISNKLHYYIHMGQPHAYRTIT